VYLDLNKNSTLDAGEPTRITDTNGDYSFSGIAAGSYRVAEVLQPGWKATTPISNDVTVLDGRKIRSDFFVFAGGAITGTVWNDADDDGIRQSTDPGLANWSVFLDLNVNLVHDSGEPSTITDRDGSYRFYELAPGDYEVTEVLPTGWEAAKKNDWRQTAKVSALEETVQDFGNVSFTNGGIQGTVFNDLNADGIRDVNPITGDFTEPGLEGWTIFVDINLNGALDGTDLATLTDSDGEYSFLSLDAGDYEVIEVLPLGWDLTPSHDVKQTVSVRGGDVTTAPDFANFTVLNGSITGLVWKDLNRDGLRDFNTLTGSFLDPPIAGWQVFIDLNRNRLVDSGEPAALTNASGQYVFSDLQVGEYEVQEILPTGWEVSPTFNDSYSVRVVSGVNTVAPDFANFDSSASAPGSVSGIVWNDLNENGVQEATEPGLGGVTVYWDQNNDGSLNVGENQIATAENGSYTFASVSPGTVSIGVLPSSGWNATFPAANSRTVTLRGGQDLTGLNFGRAQLRDSSISGVVFADSNKNGMRDAGEHGLAGITVYIDVNNNRLLDTSEPSLKTSNDEFYTPTDDEAGNYRFTHLAQGNYIVRTIVPDILNATPPGEIEHAVSIVSAENRTGINTAAVYRPTEIRGLKFEDINDNHVRDEGEPAIANATIFVDLNRNNLLDEGEPSTVTSTDGSYVFRGLSTGAYVIREMVSSGHRQTYPTTMGGILWPAGTSNPATGMVTPSNVTTSLAQGEVYSTTVSITLPNTGALTSLVDVFLLFDDTGSFVNNSPIVRAAFPDIIARLNASLPGIDLGFGVGRMEEYANFASEYNTGRPFILNQPIVAASSAGYLTSIQAALNRTAPGYGGDEPETDIEALYQVVTGKGFDGNNNGSVLDSGRAGLVSTQINPGPSGDVPSFASFTADPTNAVMPSAGNVGGAGFRAGALPIILLATDTGFAYQPKGETSIHGVGSTSLPISALTQTSRPTTPFNSGAGIQETVTGLNALGALVIGLGTNPTANVDPRQQLESLSLLTGATNRSTVTIPNGTADAIGPGDPLYFQIASGFGSSVANGIVSAIQNAVTNVAVDIEVRASDPRVRLTSNPGIRTGIGSGMSASFDISITGDGAPRRFDIQFVRAGTNVVLGSIPVVLGTPIEGDGYHYDELEDGEIEVEDDFGDHSVSSGAANTAPSFVKGSDISVLEDSGAVSIANWATGLSPGGPSEVDQILTFVVENDNAALFEVAPTLSSNGSLSFTPKANANGVAIVTVRLRDNGGTALGGIDTSGPSTFIISVAPVNDAPVAVNDQAKLNEDTTLVISVSGLLSNDSDVDSSSLTATLLSGPAHGTLRLHTNGDFEYVPNENFFGADQFTYSASDGSLSSNVATVAIVVEPVNDIPVAFDEEYATDEDTPLVIVAPGVLGNDRDVDSINLTGLVETGPSHGSVMLRADGSFMYTPAPNYVGTDHFTYRASDGIATSNLGTVNISVMPVNDAPVATNDSYELDAASATIIAVPGVLANDFDIDSTFLTAMLVQAPAHGTLTLRTDGSFSYVPNVGYFGADLFSYKVHDGLAESNVADVSLLVRNLPPVATDDRYITDEDTPLVISVGGLLSNDTDPEHATLQSTLVSLPSHGTVAVNRDGSFTYLPADNFYGTDSFTYKANDGLWDSNVATVLLTVNSVNDAPQAFDDAISVTTGVEKTVIAPGVLHNDVDVDNATLNAELIGAPQHGTVTLQANGSFSYVSTAGYVGLDEFTYSATDGENRSNIARVSIQVNAANDSVQLLVIDQLAKQTFSYGSDGKSNGQNSLNKENKKARGIASTSDGSLQWVVDSDGIVFVYGLTGKLLGSWKAEGIDKPEGIAVAGDNLWIVDTATDRTYLFTGAGLRRSGTAISASSFALDRSNRDPKDIVTDGSRIWVVNDTSNTDSVFRYSLDGKLQGSWTIDAANKTPTGIAIDASNPNHVWIVDAGTDRIYQYEASAGLVSGQRSAARSFALNTLDKDPQGISIRALGVAKPGASLASPRPEDSKTSEATTDTDIARDRVVVPERYNPYLKRADSIHDAALLELLLPDRSSESWTSELVPGESDDAWFDASGFPMDLEVLFGDLAKAKRRQSTK
jgi:VCBS repeat-containing protein